jgi:Polyketide cyclase / dehydrase and lipid transport
MTADLFARNELSIEASCETVWKHLVDAEKWPQWYPNSKDVQLIDGATALGPNVRWRWTTFGLGIESRVQEYAPYSRLGWYGYAPGTAPAFYHTWLLQTRASGCLVNHGGSGAGQECRTLARNRRKPHASWPRSLARDAQVDYGRVLTCATPIVALRHCRSCGGSGGRPVRLRRGIPAGCGHCGSWLSTHRNRPHLGIPMLSFLMGCRIAITRLFISGELKAPVEIGRVLERPVARSKDRTHELFLSGRSDQCTARGYSRIRSAPHRRRPGGFRRGSGHLAALSLSRVGTLWRKTRAQCGVDQSIEIPRWTISMGGEPLGALHRHPPSRQNYHKESCEPHRCERGTTISSVQNKCRCYSPSLHHHAARRSRMHDVDYNAGAARPASTRVRILRPGASLQTVSPKNRYAPIGLASRHDSPIRRSGRLRKGFAC